MTDTTAATAPIVLRAPAEFRYDIADRFRDDLIQAETAGNDRVVVDFTDVVRIDYYAMCILVGRWWQTHERYGWTRLASVSDSVREQARNWGLEKRFTLYPTVEAALADEIAAACGVEET